MSRHAPSPSMRTGSSAPMRMGSPHSFDPYPVLDDKAVFDAPQPLENRQPSSSIYRSISYILGFKQRWSLLNCIIWGGALVGFCLARSIAMNPARTGDLMPPGEWFWFSHEPWKANLFIHIYLSTLGGLGAVLQFFPAIRRRKMVLHRLNGYGVLTCLIVGNVCGAIVGRRSFGGELNVQSGYYTMGIMILFSACMGYYYVKKDTRRHRKWMLRMVAYFASTITGRLTMFAAANIVTLIGTYFSVWRCDEVLSLADNSTATMYPSCTASGINPASAWVAVHADTHAGPLFYASALRAVHGMGLWFGILLHVIGVEIYINKTEATNQVRLNFALEPLGAIEDS